MGELADMKVLIWKSKYEDVVINATDKSAAYYRLFSFNEDHESYGDLKDPKCEKKLQQTWYNLALDGDHKAAEMLTRHRNTLGYEHETFYIVDVVEP